MDDKNLPPQPFNYETTYPVGKFRHPLGNGHVYLVDGNGRKIASLWGKPEEKIALAKMIVNARNTVGSPERKS